MKKFTTSWLNQEAKKLPQETQDGWKAEWPPESFDALLEETKKRIEIVADLTGCASRDIMIQEATEVIETLRQQYNDQIPVDGIETFDVVASGISRKIAKEYEDKKLCHGAPEYMLCFCDEKQGDAI
ncbi:MAG: hypothetical protein Q8O83_01805 [bacterium]|nr:hypothetical protein [bacterium]